MLGANQPLYVHSYQAGAVDDFGRPAATYVRTASVVGNLFQRAGRELVDGQWTTVADWTALLPPTVTVTHRDVIVDADGNRYRIQTVAPRRGPGGQVRHISCRCVREGQ